MDFSKKTWYGFHLRTYNGMPNRILRCETIVCRWTPLNLFQPKLPAICNFYIQIAKPSGNDPLPPGETVVPPWVLWLRTCPRCQEGSLHKPKSRGLSTVGLWPASHPVRYCQILDLPPPSISSLIFHKSSFPNLYHSNISLSSNLSTFRDSYDP